MTMKVVTICGSMRYAKNMIVLALQLEIEKEYAVIQCVYDFDSTVNSPASFQKLSKAHFKKIEVCDALYVVNIDGYIGSSTKQEIEFAMSLGKEVIYHEH